MLIIYDFNVAFKLECAHNIKYNLKQKFIINNMYNAFERLNYVVKTDCQIRFKH